MKQFLHWNQQLGTAYVVPKCYWLSQNCFETQMFNIYGITFSTIKLMHICHNMFSILKSQNIPVRLNEMIKYLCLNSETLLIGHIFFINLVANFWKMLLCKIDFYTDPALEILTYLSQLFTNWIVLFNILWLNFLCVSITG